jgi:hypothetical protein
LRSCDQRLSLSGKNVQVGLRISHPLRHPRYPGSINQPHQSPSTSWCNLVGSSRTSTFMSSSTIFVIGATGIQGGAVCRALLSSNKWIVRALVRNISSPISQALKSQGASLIQEDRTIFSPSSPQPLAALASSSTLIPTPQMPVLSSIRPKHPRSIERRSNQTCHLFQCNWS